MANITAIRNVETVEEWIAVIAGANGKTEEWMSEVVRRIQATGIANLFVSQRDVQPEGISGAIRGMFGGKRRPFLEVVNNNLKTFVMYVSARDYGNNLNVSWYMTAEMRRHGVIARMVVQKRNFKWFKEFSPATLDIFDREELAAYTTIVHHAVTGATEDLMKNLNLDFTKVDTHTRGFLNIS